MMLVLERLKALIKRARVALPLGLVKKQRRVREKSKSRDFAL